MSEFDPDAEFGTWLPQKHRRTLHCPRQWPSLILWRNQLSTRSAMLCMLGGLALALALLVAVSVLLPQLPATGWPMPSSESGYCSPPSPAFAAWISEHRRVEHLLRAECDTFLHSLRGPSPPRLLVVTGGDPNAGLGDRLSKLAGLFLFSLISRRSFFVREAPSSREHGFAFHRWFTSTPAFAWELIFPSPTAPSATAAQSVDDTNDIADGGVGTCLERALRDPVYAPMISTRLDVDERDWGGGLWGIRSAVRRFLFPRSVTAAIEWQQQPILLMDGLTNTVRSVTVEEEFRAAVRAPDSPAPLVMHRDDSRGSLMAGCLLRLLLKPRERLLTLTSAATAALHRGGGNCSVGVHVRFGDRFIVPFDSGAGAPDSQDERLALSPEAVRQPIICAVQTAQYFCRETHAEQQQSRKGGVRTTRADARVLPSLQMYISSDNPAAYAWFANSVAELRQQQQHAALISRFASISIVHSAHGSPRHVAAFADAAPQQRMEAEQQLIADWWMLSRTDATVSTGSTLSFLAASMAGHLPVHAQTCRPN